MKILIVDDSSVMRKVLRRSVRQAVKDDIELVVAAGDGAEALEKRNDDGLNIVFSDINMPNPDGLDFLHKLRETPHKDPPVIMATTEGAEKTVMEAISLGAKGFIRKPFAAEQIESALAKALA